MPTQQLETLWTYGAMMLTDRISAYDVTEADILELVSLAQKELPELEYKSEPPEQSMLLKTACALANFGGGFLLVGIDEVESKATGVVDVPDSQRVVERFRQTLRDGITPRPVIEIVTLPVAGKHVVVVRIAPQNPPHMVSQNKRSDFYNRYDTSSERMRYDEIEQMFREKLSVPEATFDEKTPKAVLQTATGRAEITVGAKGSVDTTIARLEQQAESTFNLIAVSDGNMGSLSEQDVLAVLQKPIYWRKAGWLSINPELEVMRANGAWEQHRGGSSAVALNSSGDLTFTKAVDSVLCFKQPEPAFLRGPSLFPNAIVEYCLSFMYALSDVSIYSKPSSVLITPVFAHAKNIGLTRGEGGSIWFDAPSDAAQRVNGDLVRATPVLVVMHGLTPMRVREQTFKVLAQVYALFGYLERYVPFSSNGEVTFQADSDFGKIATLKNYLQGRLGLSIEGPASDHLRGVERFRFRTKDGRLRLIGASEEFIEDWSGSERELFAKLEDVDFGALLSQPPSESLLLLASDGVRWVAWG